MMNFWAKFKSNIFHVKQLWLLRGQFFNSPSGHSVHNRPLQVGMVAVGTYIDRY